MPNLTEKELGQLTELLIHEQELVKKCKHYAGMCQDPQLQTKCQQAAALHQNHYNTLLGQLN